MTEYPMDDQEHASYVDEPGFALLHRGDKVMAAEDSQAMLSTRPGGHIEYHFPIHVVVVGDLEEEAKCEIENRIWAKLNSALS
jgi:hypothetical protein